jgi:hypothetical protein
MHIDQTHRPWAGWSAAIVLAGAVVYAIYAASAVQGPRGGSFAGLAFGIIGYAFMLFAGFLGIRKKYPTKRIGKTTFWMRGHIWLGLISLPLILFHGGFAFRGPLTLTLMILFFIVIGSGLLGAALQHYMPRTILLTVPKETIYEEIPHQRQQLLADADAMVEAQVLDQELILTVDKRWDEPLNRQVDEERAAKEQIREIYRNRIRPFLANPDAKGAELAVTAKAEALFTSLRSITAPALHPLLKDLEDICDEERQFIRQQTLYRWLHAWLLVHVPLSVALLVLGGIHAIVALRY